ncbi:jg9037 [Pararge aegeria aegeria]|uniref:Jg9037 protein n=1 Tax=Pararge aegeria aegeria TaxID=348720 RepID=A0A8S4REF0_9NEOP|nr:jg9037 [Pararge aegeria aegeria]
MTEQNLESKLFARAIKRVQFNLKLLDLQLDENTETKCVWKNIRNKWLFWFNVILMNIATIGEVAWLIEGVSTGKSFIDLAYQAPCLTFCIACDIQCAYFVHHRNRMLELITSIRTLQSMSTELEKTDVTILNGQVKIFYITVNTLTVMKCLALSSFGLIPFLTLYLSYQRTGEVKLVLPFYIAYPFDATDIRFWPIAYIQQIWAGEQ